MHLPKIITLLVASLLLIVGVYIFILKIAVVATQPSDLNQDYIAAHLLLQGRSIYTYAEDTPAAIMDQLIVLKGYTGLPAANNHPPFDAILFIPLTLVSYSVAAVLWSLLSLVLYFLIGHIVLIELQLQLERSWMVLLLGVALCWYPLQLHISTGQLSIPLSACVIGCWALLRRRRDILAGLLLGLACLIKVFPALLIVVLVLRGRWRAAIAAMVCMSVGWLLSVVLVGPDDVLRYLTQIMPMDAALYQYAPVNLSLGSLLNRIVGNGLPVPFLDLGPSAVRCITMVGTLGLMALLTYQAWSEPRSQLVDDRVFALGCIIMVLISPITWQHIFPVLVLPLGLLLRDTLQNAERRQLIYSAFIILFLSLPYSRIAAYIIGYNVQARIPLAAILLFFTPTIGLFLLCWLLAARSTSMQQYRASRN